MVLSAVYRMARCFDYKSVHQHLCMAESRSVHASDDGHGEAYMQFAGRCWLRGPQIFISGWDWTECTFGFLGESELLIPLVPPACLSQRRTCVF